MLPLVVDVAPERRRECDPKLGHRYDRIREKTNRHLGLGHHFWGLEAAN